MSLTVQKILVAESDSALRGVLVEQLRGSGYETEEADSGVVALQKITSMKLDLVILGALMTSENGVLVLEEMNKSPDLVHIPVIVVVSYSQSDEIKRFKHLGVKDFIVKETFEPSDIIEKAKKVIFDNTKNPEPSMSKNDNVDELKKKTTQQGGEKKVLVVEDDKFLRELFIKKLYNEGFDVKNTTNATATFEILESEWKPEIILLDIILQGEDGFSILGKLKQDSRLATIPVIVLSNLGQKEDIDKAMSLGAVDFMIKANFTLEEIVERVRKEIG